MKKIIIWDLCGGSQNSVYNALKHLDDVEIHTFDITLNEKETENHKLHKLDLTLPFFLLHIEIENRKIPRPDFIFSSPPCNAFSQLVRIPKNKCTDPNINETLGIMWNGNKYDFRPAIKIANFIKEIGFFRTYKVDKIQQTAHIGMSILNNVLQIIDFYNPLCWYIENPKQSIMFNIIDIVDAIDNHTYYSAYDNENFTLKPTNFLSNIQLSLRKQRVKSKLICDQKNQRMALPSGDGGLRAKIPAQLLQDIYSAFKEIYKWQKEQI